MGYMNRNLDSCHFRVKRNGVWQSICFSDLTSMERDELFDGKNRPAEWWQSMAYHLADRLRHIGDELDLEMVNDE